MTRGRCSSLGLNRKALSSSPPRRFIPAFLIAAQPRAGRFESPLSDEAVLEPYFLGQQHDESLARFLEKYSKRLPPPRDSDIGETLTALSQELAARSDNGAVPCVRVLVEGKQRELNPMLRDEIYRIARETLRNAFRHAQAQKIEAEITYGDSEFLLHVRDDGTGSDPTVANQGRAEHWGLPVADILLDASVSDILGSNA